VCELEFVFFFRFAKNTQISNSMKILPVGAELFDAEHGEANSRFSQICERA